MTLTPLDIHNKEFNRAFRGYAEAEVDEFLDQVVKEFESLIRENAELKDRLDEVERQLERYRSIEDTLNKTLLLAQQAAEDARSRGEKEADIIRERARMDAKRLVDEARERAKESLDDYAEMRREAELFRMRMKTLLTAQLELFQEQTQEIDAVEGAPFAASPKARVLAQRYAAATRSDSAGRPEVTVPAGAAVDDDDPPLVDEHREEAATLDFRRPAEARPNLWGEPVFAQRRSAPPRRDDGEDDDA